MSAAISIVERVGNAWAHRAARSLHSLAPRGVFSAPPPLRACRDCREEGVGFPLGFVNTLPPAPLDGAGLCNPTQCRSALGLCKFPTTNFCPACAATPACGRRDLCGILLVLPRAGVRRHEIWGGGGAYLLEGPISWRGQSPGGRRARSAIRRAGPLASLPPKMASICAASSPSPNWQESAESCSLGLSEIRGLPEFVHVCGVLS